jgi:peptidylprolyl isomerase
MAVKNKDKVKVSYEGRFENGEVFDSTQNHGGEPLSFIAGEGMVVKGFDDAVIGMELNEEKEVIIKPADGYGEINSKAIQKVPKELMPKEIKAGMQIGLPTENGEMIPAKITDVSEKEVTIDLNHPLAGKTLIFKIKLEAIE